MSSAGVVYSVSSLSISIEPEPIPSLSTSPFCTSKPATASLFQFEVALTSKSLPSVQNFILSKKVTIINTTQARKKQYATLLTSTPSKDDLVEKESKRKAKAVKKQRKRTARHRLCRTPRYVGVRRETGQFMLR